MRRPVFVTGPSRSGTSLIAGLICLHGVWFGPCVRPRPINPTGFYESVFVKQCVKNGNFQQFARRWDKYRLENDAPSLWGVKTGAQFYKYFADYRPLVIVTQREQKQILISRIKAGFSAGPAAINQAHRYSDLIPQPEFIRPGDIVKGDYTRLEEIIHSIGLPFDSFVCDRFIKKELWHGG